ncbi:hypothetical protein ABF176_002494 [Flavobacterium psychrophilum]|nr:hypothetical protein [Flavobacterium psychrophilum]
MINFGVKEDKKLDFLRQDVKSVIYYNDGKKDSQSFYNENGDRIARFHYNDDESLRFKQEATFHNGKNTGYINYDEYDNRDSYGKYELDQFGRIIGKYHNGNIEEQYRYNHLNQIELVYFSNTGAKEFYEYDNNHMVLKQVSIQGEDSMFGSLFGGPKKKLIVFKNDDYGNILEMKTYNAENNQLLFVQKNSINENGDEIKSLNLNGDGSTYSEIYYEYEYDFKKNWILKRTLDNTGKAKSVKKRNILYFSEKDFSVEKDTINKVWSYKSKRLNGQRLALLFMALSKDLFSKPEKGQVYFESNNDGSCTLFFAREYYSELKNSIDKAHDNGKFSQSNAESDWKDLKFAIDSAEISNKENVEDLQIYNIYK